MDIGMQCGAEMSQLLPGQAGIVPSARLIPRSLTDRADRQQVPAAIERRNGILPQVETKTNLGIIEMPGDRKTVEEGKIIWYHRTNLSSFQRKTNNKGSTSLAGCPALLLFFAVKLSEKRCACEQQRLMADIHDKWDVTSFDWLPTTATHRSASAASAA